MKHPNKAILKKVLRAQNSKQNKLSKTPEAQSSILLLGTFKLQANTKTKNINVLQILLTLNREGLNSYLQTKLKMLCNIFKRPLEYNEKK